MMITRVHVLRLKSKNTGMNRCALIVALLFGIWHSGHANSISYFYHAQYWIDESGANKVPSILGDHWQSRENPNFGFIENPIWLKIDLHDALPLRAQYIHFGNFRTPKLKYYTVGHNGDVTAVSAMNFKLEQVIDIANIRQIGGKWLLIHAYQSNLPTYLGVEIIDNDDSLLVHDASKKIISWMAYATVVLIIVVSLVFYINTRKKFYLLHAMQLGMIMIFLSYNIGLLQQLIPDQWVLVIVNLSLFLFALRLIQYDKSSRSFKILAGLASIMAIMLFLTSSNYNGMISVMITILELYIIIYLIAKGKEVIDQTEPFFYFLFLFSALLMIVKMIDQFGLFPDTWYTQMLFELFVIPEFFLWLLYIGRSANHSWNKYLAQQQQLINMNRESKYALIKGQEKERDWFGKELHDNIGATLSVARLLIDHDPKSSQKYLNRIDQELIKISSSYQSPSFHISSLETSLREYLRVINTSDNVKVNMLFESSNISRLSTTDMLNVYRSVQEAINNAIKHGQASQIDISITDLKKEGVNIIIMDNGTGLTNDYKEGIGLKNIRTRLAPCELQLSLLSSGNGTFLEMNISV